MAQQASPGDEPLPSRKADGSSSHSAFRDVVYIYPQLPCIITNANTNSLADLETSIRVGYMGLSNFLTIILFESPVLRYTGTP